MSEIDAAGGRLRVRTQDMDILVIDAGGQLYAFENLCSHAGVSMERGRVRGCVITCPSHLAQFDVRDGSIVRGPIEGDPENVSALHVFPVEQDTEGVVFVEVPDDMDWRWLK
jgi:nitrite reductase/ring-hydroxylating ferredoxin subunit